MSNNLDILIIDLELNTEELRAMSNEEHEEFSVLKSESEKILEKYQEDVIKKETAIAKLVALGLSEEEIKAVFN